MRKIFAVSLALVGLNGCTEKTYTVDYLFNDREKRLEILEACKANKQSAENCTNANTAQAAIELKIKTLQQQIGTLKYKNSQAERRLKKYSNVNHDLEAHEKRRAEILTAIQQKQREIDKLKQQ